MCNGNQEPVFTYLPAKTPLTNVCERVVNSLRIQCLVPAGSEHLSEYSSAMTWASLFLVVAQIKIVVMQVHTSGHLVSAHYILGALNYS